MLYLFFITFLYRFAQHTVEITIDSEEYNYDIKNLSFFLRKKCLEEIGGTDTGQVKILQLSYIPVTLPNY